jgi:hypothetical protein
MVPATEGQMTGKKNTEAKFIEVTTISVGVLGQKSTQHRGMLNVQMIASIQECKHQEDAAVKSVIDMHVGDAKPTRHFLVEPYEVVADLVKQAIA